MAITVDVTPNNTTVSPQESVTTTLDITTSIPTISAFRPLINAANASGDGSLAYDSNTGVFTYTGPSASEVRAHLSAGTGVTYSSGQFSIGQDVAASATPTFAGVDFSDNAKIRLGTGNDLEIYHDGSHSHILEKGTGSLSIDTAHFAVRSGATDDADTTPTEHIRMQVLAGAAGSTAFSAGNESTGSLSNGMTNARLVINPISGSSAGTTSIKGRLLVSPDPIDASKDGSGDVGVAGDISATNLNISGNFVIDGEITKGGSGSLVINDSTQIKRSTGAATTLSILHTGSQAGFTNNAVIELGGTNGAHMDFKEPSSDNYDLRIEHGVNADNESLITSKHPLIIQTESSGGDVTIKREGSAKLATTATGIDVTGEVKGDSLDIDGNADISGNLTGVDTLTATTFSGSGASLTNLPAAQLSGAIANGVTATTQSASDNSTKVATTAYTDTAIANLVNSAPSTLDTLGEIATSLNNNASLESSLTSSIATKLPLAGGQMTGNITFSGTQTVDGRDLSADGTKLDGIEASATADQTAAEIRALVESASDSNVFTDDDHSKLNAIEASATADQTAAEIRTLVESASDSNVFTDADHSKLNAIEASADVTDATNVTAAGALMDSELTDLAGIKSLDTSTLQVKPSEGAFANGDKTKLDAIEASADVTDTANVTAAGALMDSEVTNLAQVKAFDASDYAPAAGSGNIVTTGALNSGSITSGFTSIDVGSGAISTTGTISAGSITANPTTDVNDGSGGVDVTLILNKKFINTKNDAGRTLTLPGSATAGNIIMIVNSSNQTLTINRNTNSITTSIIDTGQGVQSVTGNTFSIIKGGVAEVVYTGAAAVTVFGSGVLNA